MAKAKEIYAIKDIDFPLQLLQQKRNRFTVIYGLQIKKDLSYTEAAREFGYCLLHNLACAGRLEDY